MNSLPSVGLGNAHPGRPLLLAAPWAAADGGWFGLPMDMGNTTPAFPLAERAGVGCVTAYLNMGFCQEDERGKGTTDADEGRRAEGSGFKVQQGLRKNNSAVHREPRTLHRSVIYAPPRGSTACPPAGRQRRSADPASAGRWRLDGNPSV